MRKNSRLSARESIPVANMPEGVCKYVINSLVSSQQKNNEDCVSLLKE
jgi:hypothetical protein